MPALAGKRGRKRKAPEDDGRTGPPFDIVCPALPQEPRRKKGDYFYDSDYPGDKTLQTHKDLEVTYSIEPGSQWRNDLRGYSRMRYQDEEIKVGDFVFVNKDTGLSAVPSDLNNDELVKWHLDHSYVGRIQQIRAVQAAKTDKVYLMIFYLYWPEELPGGRASYHGKREVVLSNHAELVEAQTVSDFADIQFWDEGDESVVPPRELYYRQTYNVAKGAAEGRLSQLRKHCVCRKEHNPDKIMYHCSHKECVAWNHEECLEDALLKTLKTHRQKGTLTSYLDERAAAWLSKKESQSKSGADRITAGVESFVHRVRDSVMHHIEGEKSTPVPEDLFDAVEALTPGSRQKKAEADAAAAAKANQKDKKKAAPNKGELDITIKQAGEYDSVVAEVTLLPGKDPSSTSPRSWEIQLDCLVCKQPLD